MHEGEPDLAISLLQDCFKRTEIFVFNGRLFHGEAAIKSKHSFLWHRKCQICLAISQIERLKLSGYNESLFV